MHFHPLDKTFIDALRQGGQDANGQRAEQEISDGQGKPCRSCLKTVPKGAKMLIASARPFDTLHPYAETGPIFLCADDCVHATSGLLPDVLKISPDYLMKAYGADQRILYGTGQITPKAQIEPYAEQLFARDDVAYIDVRSSRNNCFLIRITREPRP
jgi:hypothetical protein